MQFKAVIFDLDGTLLNTLDDIADTTNKVLLSLGFPTHNTEKYKYFVGNGVKALIEQVLPKMYSDDSKRVTDCIKLWKEEYEKSWADKTTPYEGVLTMLTALKDLNLKLAILSNKPDEATKKAVDLLLPKNTFDIVRGHINGAKLKPDPSSVLDICNSLAVDCSDVVYIGDTATDMKTAVSAGLFPLGVLWGFRGKDELVENGAEFIATTCNDIVNFIIKSNEK